MAVDIFFLLSGVVLDASYEQRLLLDLTPLRFIWLRIVRIYPLYILGTVITLSAIFVAPHHLLLDEATPILISHKIYLGVLALLLLPNLFFLGSPEFPFDHPAWSLFFELLVNIFYAFIVRRLSTRVLLGLISFCAVALVISLVHFHLVEMGFMRHTIIAGIFRTGVSFFTGVAVFRLFRHLQHAEMPAAFAVENFCQRHSVALSFSIVALISLLLVAPAPRSFSAYYYILCIFCIFPVLVFLSLWIEPQGFIQKISTFLGDISYAIYTLHVPFYYLLCSVTGGYFGVVLWHYAPEVGGAYLLFLVCAAFCVDLIFDQPVRRMLRSVLVKA